MMNLATYQALKDGMDNYFGGLRYNRDMEDRLKQQAFQNEMARQTAALRNRESAATIANAERDFSYRKDRDTLGDQRYGDERSYQRGRDTVGDQRYTDTTNYNRGRDTVGDQRYQAEALRRAERDFAEDNMKALELSLRKKAAEARNNGGYVTEDIDPETGEVITSRRRVPVRNLPGPAAPQPHQPTGPASPAELFEAVRLGKMTKAAAKAYAREQGWE